MMSEKVISRLLAFIVWCPLLFFSVLLAHNAMLYFTHGGEYGILPEKMLARQDLLWNISFYVHLPTGIICLFAPVFLFARRFFKSGNNLHRKIGKLYVFITLSLVCPTGMYLALYAKGGLITQAGFMLQGVLLGLFTWQGYKAIATGNVKGHLHGMIRSYAVATVVLSFRIFHILFFLWNVPYQDNYAISQWLGLSGNLLLAEGIIIFMNFKLKNTLHLKSQLA